MRMTIGVIVVILSVASIASADLFGTGDNQFTIDFVNISGDASSANGTNISPYPPGDIRYETFTDPGNYRMGTYEITNDQWDKFQASYGTVMGSPWRAYDESSTFTSTNVPTNEVSWLEGAQFVNWLNTSTDHPAAYKFTGTQGTSNYTLGVWEVSDVGYDSSNPYRNSNAYYFLPTEDEWVKAAYWNGTNLQTYANASPGDLISGLPDPGKWNYGASAESEPWDVGSGSEELNGTFDMMGNVWEKIESPYNGSIYLSGSDRCARGSSFYYAVDYLSSSGRAASNPYTEAYNGGLRVASIPEPTTLLLLGLGGLMLRRKR